MKYNNYNIGGTIVKQDDRYEVADNTELKNLILSSTKLNANKSTTGHSHVGQEEVYFFIKGEGKMELDDETIEVGEGDVVLVKSGVFHRVHAGPRGCIMNCVFDGKRRQ